MSGRKQVSLNGEWKFVNQGFVGAEAILLDESDARVEWRSVQVPHDWSVESPFSPDFDGADGRYSFQVGTENQSRLYIDDQLVVDHWMRDNRARIVWDEFDSDIGLKSGKHKIVLTVNNGNYERYNLYGEFPSMRNLFEVRWKTPGTQSHVPIPLSASFP